MAPIPTVYRGIEYRSRLEARWAAFMSNIGWEYVYEPFDGDGYIPDFIVHGDRPLFVEVKPATTPVEYRAPQDKIASGLLQFGHDVLIVGADPFPPFGFAPYNPMAGMLGEFSKWTRYGPCQACGFTEAPTVGPGCRRCWTVELSRVMGRPFDEVLDLMNAPAADMPTATEHALGEAIRMMDTSRLGRRSAIEDSGFIWGTGLWFRCLHCKRFSVYHDTMWFVGRPCGCHEGDHHLGGLPVDMVQSMWADACNDVKWRGRAAS